MYHVIAIAVIYTTNRLVHQQRSTPYNVCVRAWMVLTGRLAICFLVETCRQVTISDTLVTFQLLIVSIHGWHNPQHTTFGSKTFQLLIVSIHGWHNPQHTTFGSKTFQLLIVSIHGWHNLQHTTFGSETFQLLILSIHGWHNPQHTTFGSKTFQLLIVLIHNPAVAETSQRYIKLHYPVTRPPTLTRTGFYYTIQWCQTHK